MEISPALKLTFFSSVSPLVILNQIEQEEKALFCFAEENKLIE
jgi:hypothetical protein